MPEAAGALNLPVLVFSNQIFEWVTVGAYASYAATNNEFEKIF